MDKGKKPVEKEEEDFLSLDEDEYDPNMILSPAVLAPPDFSILSEGILGSGKETETSFVDQMEASAKEDFFRKFLHMNFSDQSSPKMNEQHSKLQTSTADNFPIAEADNKPPVLLVPTKVNTLPPRKPLPPPPLPPMPPAPDTNVKPVVFRKTMPPDELAEVAICDPKRAKRIMTNRLSAIRAKEKKKLYMYMLEHKLHSLQSKSSKLSARLTLLQTESNSLCSENNILKDRMDIIIQQLYLQESLNDQIRSEIHQMRNVLAQIAPNYETITGFSGNNNHARNAQQLVQLQLQNPYQHQQVQLNFQQQQLQENLQKHRYIGLCNFGGEYEHGECSQRQQHKLQQQQNPQPYDYNQVQNEEEQSSEFELMHAEDDSVDDSQSSPSEEQK